MSDDLISLVDARSALAGAEMFLARARTVASLASASPAERELARRQAESIDGDVRVLRTLIAAYERMEQAHRKLESRNTELLAAHKSLDRLLGAIETIRGVVTCEHVTGQPPTSKMLDDAFRSGERIGGDAGDAVVGTVRVLRELIDARGKEAP